MLIELPENQEKRETNQEIKGIIINIFDIYFKRTIGEELVKINELGGKNLKFLNKIIKIQR